MLTCGITNGERTWSRTPAGVSWRSGSRRFRSWWVATPRSRPWPLARITKPGKVDPGETGISFVDVLFALVIAEGFEPLRDWDQLPNAGRWHLGVAVALTLTSW